MTRRPIFSSFMQMASPRPPMPPVTSAIRCAIVFLRRVGPGLGSFFSGAFPRVATGRGLDRLRLRVAELLARGNLLARVGLEPLRPFRPPASGTLLGLREPLVGLDAELVVHPVA